MAFHHVTLSSLEGCQESINTSRLCRDTLYAQNNASSLDSWCVLSRQVLSVGLTQNGKVETGASELGG